MLADVFSYGDGLKRKMRGLLEDPAGTVDLGARRFNEDQGGLLNLFANAYPMGGDKTVLNTPEQRKQMQAEAASKALETYGGLLGATVWHGSPHKFNKFDSSKIGTGEGAQAYGHGLYLAEAPSVAQKYADDLSSWSISTRDGVKNGGDFADHLVANAGDYPPSLSSAIRSQADKIATDLSAGKPAEQIVASIRNGPYKRMYGGLADAVEKLAPTKAGGNLYKVDLPDDAIAKMLDWDKPLSQQAPEVQKALQPMFGPNSAALTGQELYKKAAGFDSMVNVASKTGGDAAQLKRVFPQATDAQIQRAIASAKSVGGNDRIAADMLRNAGVPGIRYLDGGSRGAGGGTSNYVVFPGNEGLLQILERNGGPIP